MAYWVISMKLKKFEEEAIPWIETIYNSAYRLSGNDSDAQDLTQEVFLKAFTSFHLYEKRTNCKAWLLTILKNSFYNFIKKKKRIVNYDPSDESQEVLISKHLPPSFDKSSPEKTFTSKELGDVIQRALNKLPEDLRMSIVLCDLEELSYKDISETLSCPIGTVRSRISRARKLLQKELKTYI